MNYPLLERALIVGFGHRARQGKDLAIRTLQEQLPGGRVVRLGFGDALKAYCRAHHGMTRKDGWLLQAVGEQRRQENPGIWVAALYWTLQELDADAQAPFIACVPDVRHYNECDFVLGIGGRLCKMVRTMTGRAYIADDRDPNHISETALDDYPWPNIITAETGDIETIRAGVMALTADWREKYF